MIDELERYFNTLGLPVHDDKLFEIEIVNALSKYYDGKRHVYHIVSRRENAGTEKSTYHFARTVELVQRSGIDAVSGNYRHVGELLHGSDTKKYFAGKAINEYINENPRRERDEVIRQLDRQAYFAISCSYDAKTTPRYTNVYLEMDGGKYLCHYTKEYGMLPYMPYLQVWGFAVDNTIRVLSIHFLDEEIRRGQHVGHIKTSTKKDHSHCIIISGKTEVTGFQIEREPRLAGIENAKIMVHEMPPLCFVGEMPDGKLMLFYQEGRVLRIPVIEIEDEKYEILQIQC